MNNHETKQQTISLIKEAISILIENKEKVTQKKVAEHCKLSIRTIMRYWNEMTAPETKVTSTIKKTTAEVKKVTPNPIEQMTAQPIKMTAFERLKRRQTGGSVSASKSILESFPSFQRLMNKG